MTTRTGKILVAAKSLHDPMFGQSLVLIIRDDEKGPIGLVLNRPSKTTLKSVFEEVNADISLPETDQSVIHMGGPVHGPLTALHTASEFAEIEVLPGLYWSSTTENLTKIVASGKPYRVFTGYSGWSAGQLESEVSQGFWSFLDGDQKYVFQDDPMIWEAARGQNHNIARILGVKHIPTDIQNN